MSERMRRVAIGGLSVLGFAEALYMLAYEEGLIDSLICPFFGEGCNVVGRSEHARHLGVPNAAIGALAYGVLGTLAAWSGGEPAERRPWPALGACAIGAGATVASAFLTWEQAVKVRAWCFWCLSSAAINAAILALSAADAPPAWRGLRASLLSGRGAPAGSGARPARRRRSPTPS
jgi:uncharacterized membrane protein